MRIPRPSYASVAATISLFLALGGSSYAALTISGSNIKNGTVTGSDLKNESVKGADVDNGSLTGSDLKGGSVTGSDVKNESLTSSDVDDGSLVAADFKSGELPAGPAGPQGPSGTTNVIVRREDALVANNSFEERTVSCQPGEIATGGGAGIETALPNSSLILYDEPLEDDGTRPEPGDRATKWTALAANSSGSPKTMYVHVLCAVP